MAVVPSEEIMVLVASTLMCVVAAADPQMPDVKQVANEIVFACTIGPTSTLESPLSSKLGEFIQQSIVSKSAKSIALTDMLAQLPTDTDEVMEQLKDPKARQMFFAIYFNCIRQQTSLRLKSLNIALE